MTVPARVEIAAVVEFAAASWALTTPASTYVVLVDKHGDLVQRYWGPRLPGTALSAFGADERVRWNSTFERPSEIEEELPIDGGHHWSVPSLQVRFPGEVRALQLTFVEGGRDAADPAVLRIVLADRGFSLTVVLEYRVHADSDVIERRVRLHNEADLPVTVLRADSGNWPIPDQADYRLSTLTGFWGGETMLQRQTLQVGEHVLTSRQGVTSHTANPWVAIDDGTVTEQHGEVRSVVLAWSGSWRITVQRRPEGQVAVTGGFGHDGLEWFLQPGGVLETPAILGQWTDGGYGAASRGWHEYFVRHLMPHPDEDRPVLYNSWEATGFDIDEARQIELAERAARLGVELFVMDDGWFGRRADDRAGLGDWWPRADRFPDGLTRVVDRVRELGMHFGVWVEPEMVNPDSALYRAHPDWVLHWPGRPRTERRSQLVLNYGREDVRFWAQGWLERLVATTGLDFLKWDMNRPFTEAGWPGTTGQDRVWIDHVRGVYAVIDSLRERFPALRIENCASGGARLDAGMLARTDQVWASDNTDALDRQTIQHGFGQLYPPGVMGAWVTDEVNPMTGRRIPLSYRFHVAMTGVLGIGADIRDWDERETAEARALILRYKTIRRTVQHGRLYRLGGVPGRDFSALQYVDGPRIVLFQFEPHRSLSTGPRRVRLAGLDPDAEYEDETGRRHAGALLMGRGVRVLPAFTDRGWDNVRFSSADYASSVEIFVRR